MWIVNKLIFMLETKTKKFTAVYLVHLIHTNLYIHVYN